MEYSSEAAAMSEKIERVVVRGSSAVVLSAPSDGGRSWATLALEDGVWRLDD